MFRVTPFFTLTDPNEPLFFWADPAQKSRSKDAIIAYAWKVFSTYPEDDDDRYQWVAHFPMVKATARAMDTVNSFILDTQSLNITRFAVAGASKRGWSTWLTAAVDERVEAFVPMVMEMPNFRINLHHMYI